MKKIILISLVLFFAKQGFSQKISKKDWITMYKEYAVYKCMCEITNDKLELDLQKKKDVSFIVHSEFLGPFLVKADSVGRSFAKNIQPLYIDKENDLYGLKPLYLKSLTFFNSKYLDSIARKSYQEFKKQK